MRWVWLTFFVVLGLVTLSCGLLIPVHLRAVDESVIEKAGRRTRPLVAEGVALVSENNFGGAQLVAEAAGEEGLRESDRLSLLVSASLKAKPAARVWGCLDSRLDGVFALQPGMTTNVMPPFTDFVVQQRRREQALEYLRTSPLPAVQELLKCRAITNTVLFPPAMSAAGQSIDSAIAVCGLLLASGRLNPTLRDAVGSLAADASRSGDSERVENVLMDFMSLGQRFNWGQLVAFLGQVQDIETLRCLAELARQADSQIPELFSVVLLSGRPDKVAGHLMGTGIAGLKDLRGELRYGAGGLNEMLDRNQRLYRPRWRQNVVQYDPFASFYALALYYCLVSPILALVFKWLCYIAVGFCIVAVLHFAKARSRVNDAEAARGFRVARQIFFALGFLLVVLLATEPFLSQDNQKGGLPLTLRLPTVGGAVRTHNPGLSPSSMNQTNLFIMLLFFVLQGLLYTACVVKLADVRRQKTPPQVKLRLLENEDHLFDAGLYLGFLGTIVSFILYSLSVVHQFSLMVAYSSTAFGITFVSFFKIFHLRSVRRKLLLEADASSLKLETPAPSIAVTTSP